MDNVYTLCYNLLVFRLETDTGCLSFSAATANPGANPSRMLVCSVVLIRFIPYRSLILSARCKVYFSITFVVVVGGRDLRISETAQQQ